MARKGERKEQILHTLAVMLEEPHASRITTAALAARMQLSEAALYRHFASKAQMFESLITSIEADLFDQLLTIKISEREGSARTRKMVMALLDFAERRRGVSRVLTGEALVTEDSRLQCLISAIHVRIESVLFEALADAVTPSSSPVAIVRANLLAEFILGRWLRYAQTGWDRLPTSGASDALELVLAR